MKLLYALALIPFAAFANPLTTDFEQVFAQHSETAVEENGVSSVELPGKILLSRNSEGQFLALDGSAHEAVGCLLRITLQSSAIGQLCPESMSDEQTATLAGNIADFAAFYAANNVPVRDVAEVQEALEDALDALKDRMAALQCTPNEVSQFKQFIAALTSEETQDGLALNLADARLPVTQPCQ